jgi:hypothetical protein
MGKTLTIRKSAEDESWLRQQQQRTARSQGEIVKDLLRQARARKPENHPLMRFCGDLPLADRKASSKKGFS